MLGLTLIHISKKGPQLEIGSSNIIFCVWISESILHKQWRVIDNAYPNRNSDFDKQLLTLRLGN